MKSKRITWHRLQASSLNEEAREAKHLVLRICEMLSKLGNRKFTAKMSIEKSTFEGHIIDHGKFQEDMFGNEHLAEEGDEVGMIFWGGHFNKKKDKDALSHAWISLLEDCIGSCKDREIVEIHNLSRSLREVGFGPYIDLNCKSKSCLEVILGVHGC